tara:strand:- start:1109 stop:1966 length:858 start_codon:yes stop_codon:yes gene_type:complete
MINKIVKIALVGKTNAGKSTLINSLVGEEISIINKKINTTQESLLGIKNIKNIQFIFYDTPGFNISKLDKLKQKKFNLNLWQSIFESDVIIYLLDVKKYDFKQIQSDILKIKESNKKILLVFNKIDLINRKNILIYINELKNIDYINEFFLISAKYSKGLKTLLDFLKSKSYKSIWPYQNDEITNKDDIYITTECTRNSILEYLHKEIPYNIEVKNTLFKYLKNNDLKIKQIIELTNKRYKPIILGKKGETIKKIREKSQQKIKKILKCKVHLYLQINTDKCKKK